MTMIDGDLAGTNRPDELSLLVIQLFKGPLYRDRHEKLWEPLNRHRRRVADHVAVLGLRLEVDESDGYAFLRSLRDGESEIEYPRLVARHTLSFTTSLLIALLRKRLLEFDTSSSEARLVLGREQILDLIRIHLPQGQDDIRIGREIDRHIKRLEELGFLHRLRGSTDQFEVRRIIRAFVDGQWLGEFDRRLSDYVRDGDTSASAADDDAQIDVVAETGPTAEPEGDSEGAEDGT